MSNPRITLDQVNLVVSNMPETVAFYRLLGLTIPDTRPEWDGDHRSAVDTGDLSLDFDSEAFAARWDAGWPGGSGVVLGFRVETREAVDGLYQSILAAGYRSQQPPYDAFWGARYAIVQDPDGLAVGIMSPADPARRGPMPPPQQ